MECDGARHLMMEALDGHSAPELERHLGGCAACADEMRALAALDALLRSQPLVEPPAHFASRVMSHVDRRVRAMPRWQVGALRVGAIATGTLMLGLAAAALLHGWRIAVVPLLPQGALRTWLDGLRVALPILTERAPSGLAAALVAVGLASILAVVWFGALVAPRHAPGVAPARARARPSIWQS